jgi:hypothetical protein
VADYEATAEADHTKNGTERAGAVQGSVEAFVEHRLEGAVEDSDFETSANVESRISCR